MQAVASVIIGVLVLLLMLPPELMNLRRRHRFDFSKVVRVENLKDMNQNLRILIRMVPPLKRILRLNFDNNKLDKLRDDLRYVNALQFIPAEDFCYLKILLAVLGALFFGLQYVIKGEGEILFSMIGCAGVLYMMPTLWLNREVNRRRSQIRQSVPYVFSLFSVLTEAGLGITQAMEEIGVRANSALTQEIQKATDEIRLGIPASEALDNLARRTNVEEITYFVSAVTQALEKGSGGIAGIVKEHARFSWEARKVRAREMADKASMKMFIPLLFLVMPAMIIFLMGPMVFSLFKMLSQGV